MDGSFVQQGVNIKFTRCKCGGEGGGLRVGGAFVQSAGKATFSDCSAREGGGLASWNVSLTSSLKIGSCQAVDDRGLGASPKCVLRDQQCTVKEACMHPLFSFLWLCAAACQKSRKD